MPLCGLFDSVGRKVIVALLQDISLGDAFECRMLTPYSVFAASLR